MMKTLRNIKLAGTVFFCLIFISCGGTALVNSKDPSLDSAAMEVISDAVMEVVAPKPAEESLQYEKLLPLDLLPYGLRTDKYYSIGTAFAIGPSEFVSAAHVMKLGSESRLKEIFLRDKSGKVYPVDNILKYSLNRDFAVFSLYKAKAKRFLPVNTNPLINQKVYAVGNALGQGIVIRDGLYTSDTPEEEAGEWKWIRFSAAASPGNSGGPLLDGNGKVIGIVLRKSASENLNYAIPIGEVINAKKDTAVIHMGRVVYRLDNMDMTIRGALHKEIILPKTYKELTTEFKVIIATFFQNLLKDLLAENRNGIFPLGPGSTRLIYNVSNTNFPLLIAKGQDGNWGASSPKDRKNADLGDNGSISYGIYGKTFIMLMRKPDTIPLQTIYSDSKQFMDLILKSGLFLRYVGPEQIKITSMGMAAEDYRVTDAFGRIWIVRSWLSEYDDTRLVTFTLPIPGGCAVIMRKTQTDMAEIIDIPELKVLIDFVYMSYQGVFKDWQEFLQMKNQLPAFFSSTDIYTGRDGTFRFKSARLSFFYGTDIMQISEKSFLMLGPVFLQEQGKTVLDIGKITISEDRFDQTSYNIQRVIKPPKELPDQYHSSWEKMAEHRFPYNRSAYFKDKVTIIESTFGGTKVPQKADAESPSRAFLYTVGYTKSGTAAQKEMETKLDTFLKDLTIYEEANSKR